MFEEHVLDIDPNLSDYEQIFANCATYYRISQTNTRRSSGTVICQNTGNRFYGFILCTLNPDNGDNARNIFRLSNFLITVCC